MKWRGVENLSELLNFILIGAVLSAIILTIYFLFKKDFSIEGGKSYKDKHLLIPNGNSPKGYTLHHLTKEIKETINTIQNTSITELNLNKTEAKKRMDLKAKLDRAIRNCCTGDLGQKEYLKEYIGEILQNKYSLNETNIDFVIPFNRKNHLDSSLKFLILLYQYRREYGEEGFLHLFGTYFQKGSKSFSITHEDIEEAYERETRALRFVEKLDILTQVIYQTVYGHGVIDFLREEKTIDDIAGGVSGVEGQSYKYMEEHILDTALSHKRHDSIWIVFRGKQIRLEFMTFKEEEELERVVHNLYRNVTIGWMSSKRGYIVTDSKDGDRITCCRPPFSESYAFWIRKFSSVKSDKMENLITHKGSYIPITIIKALIRGAMTVVFTGETNSGKTTLLKAAVGEIDDTYPIRTLELFLEMWLSRLYPNKQIVAFRTTQSISVSDTIALIKKTNPKVIIAGESQDFETAAKVVELSLVGSKFTLSTCHPMTTEGLIEYHTNAVMSKNIELYSDDRRAEASVAKALNFDVHMVRTKEGERYIERITEIIPIETDMTEWPQDTKECLKLYMKLNTRRRMYETKDIVVFENNEYIYKNPISENGLHRMFSNMSPEEIEEYTDFLKMGGCYDKAN